MTHDPAGVAREYAVYERVRDAVVELTRARASAGPEASPSAYWTEELENIDYMVEASPLIVRKLRHHSFHLTGIRPYDYRSKDSTRQPQFEARLAALRELGGDALCVPESPALGGFGYRINGQLFNVDTLKFYEVLIGMERGGVLRAMRALDRPTVCEIGAGWAGFAFQFKTLFPRCRYVIVDFAELFLFSATYLGAVFPDATLAFVGTAATPTMADAAGADFVFVPHTLAHLVEEVPLDLTVNMVSFQEMTGPQVRGYAAMAAAARCPWLYSMNRERSPYNTELVTVSGELAAHYALTEVEVLGTDYTTAMKKAPKAGKPVERTEFNYRHFAGQLPSPRPADARSTGVTAARATSGEPRVVLGMTLYNNARHLPEALDSLLAQSTSDFVLVLLDDASSDDTERVAREFAARDARIRYHRHATRQAMVATWHEVAGLAARECPSARYFAWVSDHDRWHPEWLARLLAELEAHPDAVLAYPITRRIDASGVDLDKGPRLFDTSECDGVRARWTHMCHYGIGAGDMVYGLMRLDALVQAGTFRRVLRPDRLLVAELALRGRFRQVQEVLWFRRDASGASVDRQRHTLVVAGDEPEGFGAPPWWQHARVLWREYTRDDATLGALGLSKTEWALMLARYQVTYGWRHFRKTEASHAIGRGIDQVVWTKKITKHYWHHAVYNALVGSRALWGRLRRGGRRALYEVLVAMHRLGLRGRGKPETR